MSLIIEIPALLLALILHEISHGYMALWCGDGTAKMMGRLSLNPSHHLDPIGSLCMVLLGFGWAKPVPVNPRNYKNYVRDDFLVSIAGIAMNMLLFLLSTVILTMLTRVNLLTPNNATYFLSCRYAMFYEVYSYTGTSDIAVFFRYEWLLYIQHFFAYFSLLNLGLALFNLLPVPPLDGSKILGAFLPNRLYFGLMRYERYGSILLIVLLYSNLLDGPLSAVRGFLIQLMMRAWL